jgi:hypothetical protein
MHGPHVKMLVQKSIKTDNLENSKMDNVNWVEQLKDKTSVRVYDDSDRNFHVDNNRILPNVWI